MIDLNAIIGGFVGCGKTFIYLAWFRSEYALQVAIEKRRLLEFVR